MSVQGADERRSLRILLAGEWLAEIHEPAWARGLREYFKRIN